MLILCIFSASQYFQSPEFFSFLSRSTILLEIKFTNHNFPIKLSRWCFTRKTDTFYQEISSFTDRFSLVNIRVTSNSCRRSRNFRNPGYLFPDDHQVYLRLLSELLSCYIYRGIRFVYSIRESWSGHLYLSSVKFTITSFWNYIIT